MVKKYFIDPESVAFKEGFEYYLGKRDYMKLYSGRTQYGEYINYKAGIEQAKREIKMYGKYRVVQYHRFQVCLSAVGKSEKEVREIISLPDGNVWKHEYNGIFLALYSTTSDAFNNGVHAVLFGDKTNSPYDRYTNYGNWINWLDGIECTEFAIKLHGRETVIKSL
ncbi:MAG: hypothetical protein KAI25_06905 [Hyphomicrobiaceae bacterium]|nr:hypothetical protein [Hyphomicrobiaceae bacterium]